MVIAFQVQMLHTDSVHFDVIICNKQLQNSEPY